MKRSKKLSLSLLALASGILVASTAIGLASCTTTSTQDSQQDQNTQNSEVEVLDITNYGNDQEINISTITRLSINVENSTNSELVYSWSISKPSTNKTETIEKTNVNYLDVDTSKAEVAETWTIGVKVSPKEDKTQVIKNKSISLKVEPKYDYGSATWIKIDSLTISKSEVYAGGDTSTLSVSAKSTDNANLSYQWMVAKDGLHFENIYGATSSTYTVQKTDTHTLRQQETWKYAVQINNGRITTQSDNLELTIKPKDVVFLGQSIVATSMLAGEERTLGVYAEWKGDPKYKFDDMLYDWYVKKPGTDEFVHRQGGKLSTYKFTAPWINKYEQYELYVQAYPRSFYGKPNKDEIAQFSQKIVLTILPQQERITATATIDSESITPGQKDVVLTANATTTVESAQDRLHYQWQILKNGVWKNINGANSKTYVIGKDQTVFKPNEVWQYRCIVTGISGAAKNTNVVKLTINNYPGIVDNGNTDNNSGNSGNTGNNGNTDGNTDNNSGNNGNGNETENGENSNPVNVNTSSNITWGYVEVDSNYNARINAEFVVTPTNVESNDSITYQWYYTTTYYGDYNSGKAIEGETNNKLVPSKELLKEIHDTGKTAYFYCKVSKNGKLSTIADNFRFYFNVKMMK